MRVPTPPSLADVEVHQLLIGRDLAVPSDRSNPIFQFAGQACVSLKHTQHHYHYHVPLSISVVGFSNRLLLAFTAQMANYVYLIVDGDSAIAVDPCWDVAGVFDKVEELGAVLKTAVFTHRHFDHTGGKLPKAMTRGQSITLEGVAEVLAKGASVHMGMDDRDSTARSVWL